MKKDTQNAQRALAMLKAVQEVQIKGKKLPRNEIRLFDGTHEFLSNFHNTNLFLGGKTWQTSEHFFTAMKTTNPKEREKIRLAPTPGKAKRLGRKVELRPDWEIIKIDVMRFILKHKFSEGSILAEKLLATGESKLVEGNNWHDQFWGDCDCEKHITIPGRNMLGEILMDIRADLKRTFNQPIISEEEL